MARKPIFDKRNMPRPQMEVYTSGHAKSWVWNALPSPVASLYSLIAAGSITGLAYFFGDRYESGQGYTWSLIAIGIMTLLGFIVGGFRAARAKKEAREGGGDEGGFGEALKSSASGWDSGASDPAEIARLDDLRKNFQKGIDTFAEYGKDLYSLPWYVIMGEPGSGKTEAIRRSELRFPEALQDKLQGTGGTYSMHWWFTNQAIIIDTAGAMLLQSEAAGRFEEFLNLLRAHRKECPINGLILTIPVDSLLSDSPPAAEQKAKMIAIQLGIIQKALDVRFPIYLMISKSDRLPGFREYFDADGQSAFERQMMGWSNPDPLGTPFEPERIYEAIDAISTRLHSRALALLADPIPPNPASRRLDEVDAVYNFPQVIRTLAPRLRLYLDIIFQTGTWATKPPFFRGVYFSSALREGAQLDQQLAQALGLPLQQLPPGGIFSREKAVFLRDMFIEKIFMERGLVTRLVDIGAHLRRRLMTFYGVTAALLLLAIGFAWMVKSKLRSQLELEQDYWNAASAGWDNGTFIPLIKREKNGPLGRPQWTWRGNDPARGNTSRLKLLNDIRGRVHESLTFSWVFSPISEWNDYLRRRREGYLTVFEGSVMKPLLDGVRERILWDTTPEARPSDDTQKKLAEAYKQLLLLEEWLAPRGEGQGGPEPDWLKFVQALSAYLLAPAPPGGLQQGVQVPVVASVTPPPDFANDVVSLIKDVYGKEVDIRSRGWMSERESVTRDTSALSKAAGFLFGRTVQEASMNDQKKADLVNRKRAAMSQVEQAERVLRTLAKDKPAGPRNVVESEGLKPLFEAAESYRRVLAEEAGSERSSLSFEIVTTAVEQTRRTAEVLGEKAPEGLREALAAAGNSANLATSSQGATAVSPEGDWNAMAARIALYRESFEPMKSTGIGLPQPRLGGLKQALEAAGNLAAQATASTAPPAKDSAPTDDTERLCAYLRTFRGTPLVSDVFRSYAERLKRSLDSRLKFPLVNCSADYPDFSALQNDCAELDFVERDIQDLNTVSGPIYQCEERQSLEAVLRNLSTVFAIKKALLGTGSTQQDGSLWISLDAVKPVEEKTVDTPPPAPLPFGPQGFPTQPAPPLKTRDGCTNVKVVIDNSVRLDQLPSGRGEQIFFKGIEVVDVHLSFARSGKIGDDVYVFRSERTRWPLLRRVARGTNRFAIESTGRSFRVNSAPPLPSTWPSRQDFGLDPEPPP